MMHLALGLSGTNNRKDEKVKKEAESYTPRQVKRAAMASLLAAVKADDIDDAMDAFDLLMSCEEE
jgi:hypothetical protein